MQESRLFKIIYYLLERGKATAPELAERFEVSVRTIYRDIDALSAAGIPVYATQGKGGGVSLLEGYVMDKTVISGEEQQQIITALQSISSVSGDMDGLLLKLGALFRQTNTNWIQVDFSRWGNSDADQAKFDRIKEAVIRKQVLAFHYFTSYGNSQDRKVRPARLIYKSNAWYLQAYCMDRKDYRVFKLNRIQDIKLQDERFTDILQPPPIDSETFKGTYSSVRLKFKAAAAYRVYDEFAHSDIELQPNGDLIVSQNLPEDAWLYGYLLSFCGNVDVMEPEHIKNEFAETIERMRRHYSGKSRK